MAKNINTTPDDVRSSVASIYSDLLEKRRIEREARDEKKRQEREARLLEKEEKNAEDGDTKKSKKERREAELDNWKEVIIGLTGDDLEYAPEKKSRKKYKKWIGEETENVVLNAKPKKVKKKNYQKEFEPELNMLKTIVSDQNKFTADLQRRFNNAVGPATKDAPIPNKTLVELASVINAGRSNSLGILREVGGLKKTIADLYMKQKKLDSEMGGGGFNTTDIGLMGSNIASALFADTNPVSSQSVSNPDSQSSYQPQASQSSYQQSSDVYSNPSEANQLGQPSIQISSFDPDTWDGGPDLTEGSMVPYEQIPHSVIVEWNKNNDSKRFKAVRSDTGEEIAGYPVPTSDISKLRINEKDMKVKGEFDEIYTLEIV